MRNFTVLGESLPHTMSPFIHKRLFELDGKTGNYTITEIKKGELSNHKSELEALAGYNITIPHKTDVIPLLNDLSEHAVLFGAVNCVKNENGISIGYNTDAPGFLKALEYADIKLKGNVLLLGLGGAGRMMAVEALTHGCSLTVAVRNKEKANEVLEDIKSKVFNADVKLIEINDIKGHFNLLINSTPIGMFPHSDSCPVSDEMISNCDAVFDAVYNPVETLLVKKALSLNKKATGGTEMLVYQAIVAHEIWDGSTYNKKDIDILIDDVKATIKRDYK